ncbi:hypothetical protein [Corynebacterium epidermidicanis]|uniref:hypothetical protein n=1 Tax=Corynebacterium epidermidicanis TaxID=1050174 RepID=UPI00118752B6|nr:hypothetical protein [Corynebacterium epidermidicanis]
MSAIRVLALTAITSIFAVSTTACAPEPNRPARESDVVSIKVVARANRPEEIALGTLYAEALVRRGQEAYLEVVEESEPRIADLEDGNAELILGCTGDLLRQMDPQLAEEHAKKLQAERKRGELDPNDGSWRDTVYQSMVASLPDRLAASNPSNAIGCQQNGGAAVSVAKAGTTGDDLPQNIVPVFRETAFNRHNRDTLNIVSGAISDDDLRAYYIGPKDSVSLKNRAAKLLDSYSV